MLRDAPLDEYQLAARRLREAVKDKAYRAYPMGQEAASYLRARRGNLSPSSYRSVEGCLDKLARHFPDLEISDFEPPVGVERLEEFLDALWGEKTSGTYNTNHAYLSAFFKWEVLRGRLHGNPMLPIPRHKARDTHREIFSPTEKAMILSQGPDEYYLRRDRIALLLLLKYGLRKGALRNIQFRHFDANRRSLTVFTKGGKVRGLPIVDAAIWDDLEKLQFERELQPEYFLMWRQRHWPGFMGYAEDGSAKTQMRRVEYFDKAKSDCAMHHWWYGCLTRAGLTVKGERRGRKMHMARHSAGQALLDSTGNIKAVQKLLMHESASTTMNIYVDWDDAQLAESLRGLDT